MSDDVSAPAVEDNAAEQRERFYMAVLAFIKGKGVLSKSVLKLRTTLPGPNGRAIPNSCYLSVAINEIMRPLLEANYVRFTGTVVGNGGSYSLLPAGQKELERLHAKYVGKDKEDMAATAPATTAPAIPADSAPPARTGQGTEEDKEARKTRQEDRKFYRKLGTHAKKVWREVRRRESKDGESRDRA